VICYAKGHGSAIFSNIGKSDVTFRRQISREASEIFSILHLK
jgi:hypothetical protein